MSSISDLNYEYHDSIIEKGNLIENGFSLNLFLYPIYYPGETKVALTFYQVTNFLKCEAWINTLMEKFNEDEQMIGLRINFIKMRSIQLNSRLINFVIDCDYMEKLSFKCKYFKEIKI